MNRQNRRISNRINLILGAVSLFLLITCIYLGYLIVRNESSKVYFNLNEIKKIEWKSSNAEFYITGSKVKLTVDGEEVYNLNGYTFDNRTGKISDDLYIRDIDKDNIVIWYKMCEYHLYK